MGQRIAYDREPYTFEEVAGDHPNLWATILYDFPYLGEEQQLRIANLVLGVCWSCHERPRGCRCSNDD
jgi:hypothetical protein